MGDFTFNQFVSKVFEKPYYYIIMGILLGFFYVSFSENFASLFLIFIFTSAFAWFFFLKNKISINNVSGNTKKAFTTALIAQLIFMAAVFFIIQTLQPSGFSGLQSVLERMSQIGVGATPILQGNSIAIFTVGGILIPIIETEFFFVTAPQFLANLFKISLSITSPTTWMMMAFISGMFVFYHVQVKSLADNAAYLATFLFGIFQSWLVLKFREGESATWMHIQNNSLGILRAFLKPIGI